MRKSSTHVLYLLLLILFLATCCAVGQSNRLLNYSIVGSSSSDHSPSFGKAIEQIEVQKLLLNLAASSRPTAYVDSTLKNIPVSRADLEELRLVRHEGDQCFLNFTLFTAEDIRNVRSVSEHYAPMLAAAFLSKRSAIDSILQKYDAPGVDPKAVAFIVLGCMSLDWDGLSVTAENGYRTVSSSHPDGDYVPYAEERTSMTYERIYWGSHNDQYGDACLTSFGDHFSRRRAFPEFFWAIDTLKSDSGLPGALKLTSSLKKRERIRKAGAEVGSIMTAMRESDHTATELAGITGLAAADIDAWLALLNGMTYVTSTNGLYRATIPVFTQRDRAMIRELRRIGRDLISSWLKENYGKVKDQLATTTPTRWGVSYDEGFTMIWHWIFGMANDELVKAGLFADPYAPDRVHKGFIPTVYNADAV